MTPEQKSKLKSLISEFGLAIGLFWLAHSDDLRAKQEKIKREKAAELMGFIDDLPEPNQKSVYILKVPSLSGNITNFVFASRELSEKALSQCKFSASDHAPWIEEATLINSIPEVK